MTEAQSAVPETDMTTAAPFVLLTKDDCPNCERLKLMLQKPLKGQFDDQIQVVHQSTSPEDFEALTSAHAIASAPALIHLATGRQLAQGAGLGEVKAFLTR